MARLLFCASAFVVCLADLPTGLRVDFVGSSSVIATPFISLDAITGESSAVALSWELPSSISVQSVYIAVVTSQEGVVAWNSGSVQGPVQIAYLPRSALQPASRYSWTVSVNGGQASMPAAFFTSAPAAGWALTAPIWASPCAAYGPNTPLFARFSATPSIPTTNAVASALLYVTGAPPIYHDPWNVRVHFCL
jgi:hypothetical protein